MRVLIVDDDLAVRESLSRVLCLEGYEVILADSGQEALSQVCQCPLDLVLLDLNMPQIGGWEVLRQIRAMKPSLPVIIITAQAHEMARAAAAGARALCEKPLDLPCLLDLVAKHAAYSPAHFRKIQSASQ